MKNSKPLVILLFTFYVFTSQAQQKQCFEAINSEIWSNFTKSFEDLDYNLFGSLHSSDFIRVSGTQKSLRSKKEYISGYKNNWTSNKPIQTINFRFIERICDNKRASERGIYKLTLNSGTDKEKSYYGEFHVILVNRDSKWKILIDYDTSSGDKSNNDSFNSAFAIDDYEKY